jgi:hypothetical protein
LLEEFPISDGYEVVTDGLTTGEFMFDPFLNTEYVGPDHYPFRYAVRLIRSPALARLEFVFRFEFDGEYALLGGSGASFPPQGSASNLWLIFEPPHIDVAFLGRPRAQKPEMWRTGKLDALSWAIPLDFPSVLDRFNAFGSVHFLPLLALYFHHVTMNLRGSNWNQVRLSGYPLGPFEPGPIDGL